MSTYYEHELGVGVARVSTDPEDENGQPAVSIMFPKDDPPYPDEDDNPENYNDVFLSLKAAKCLLIDLRDAVDAAVSGEHFD